MLSLNSPFLFSRWTPHTALYSTAQLNSQGVYCSLYTGQEKRSVPFATHVSCTIEMASLTQPFEVAVIDEIQMVDDSQRGQHWTNVSVFPFVC